MSLSHQHKREESIDVVAFDRDGDRLLVAEVKAEPIRNPDDLAGFTASRIHGVRYVLLVDPQKLALYGPLQSRKDATATAVLSTREVFRVYDPSFGNGRVFESYLTNLAVAWLSDLAAHWKRANPPGSAELRDTGLLDLIAGGSAEAEID